MTIGLAAGLAGGYASSALGYGFGVGYSVVSSLASYLTQEDVVNEGDQLKDLSVKASVYGTPIPIVFGTMPIEAVPLWAADKITVRHEEETGGGKGGPTITNVSYSYVADFAVSLCEGPIIGVKRIWAGTTLLYDFSSGADAATILASNQRAEGITIYTGSETQDPDPLIESYAGAGNVPAYRGQAYIVFDHLDLTPWGAAIPPIRVEVVGSGSSATAGFLSYGGSHPVSYRQAAVITNIDNGVIRIHDLVETEAYGGDIGHVHLVDLDGNYLGSETTPLVGVREYSQDNFPRDLDPAYYHFKVGTLGTGINSRHIYAQNIRFDTLPSPAGTFTLQQIEQGITGEVIYHDYAANLPQDRSVNGIAISADHKRMLVLMTDVGVDPGTTQATGLWLMYDDNNDLVDSGSCDFSGMSVGGLNYNHFGWSNLAHVPLLASGSSTTCMMESNYTHIWKDYRGLYREVFEIIDGVLTFVEQITFEASLPTGAFDYGSIYADSGVCAYVYQDYTGGDPDNGVGVFSREKLFTTTEANISDMVDDLELRSNLISGDINNAGITGTLPGYRFIGPGTLRSAIEPLQQVGHFDIVESDDVLKGVARGGAVAAVIPEADLGAYDEGAAPPPAHQVARGQETELPVEVTVGYLSPGRSYERGIQPSNRLITSSKHTVNLTLPVAMSDNKGRQVAEVLHFNAWAERNRHEIALDMRYDKLEPSDVVQYTKAGNVHTMRITETDMTPSGLIRLRGVSERASAYTSNATGADITGDSSGIGLVGPTKFIPLDIPMLRTGHNDEAFYMAGGGYYPAWIGASVFRSSDLGASYNPITSINTGAVHGITTDALGDVPNPNLWDKANSVNVTLPAGTLSSSTDESVLNGANAAAIGSVANGWEIVQWVTATLEADGSYTLSGLLRGRLGTEWATGIHAVGDTFVLLNSAIIRDAATLNAERLYKAVTFGNFVELAASQAFTYTGVNLKPYAPVYLEVSRDASGNIIFDWRRRSRFVPQPLWSPVLGEDSEAYEIDIFTDNTYTTVKRTIPASSETAAYSVADQTTDFGGAQSVVYVHVHQISATVNRGYQLEEAA